MYKLSGKNDTKHLYLLYFIGVSSDICHLFLYFPLLILLTFSPSPFPLFLSMGSDLLTFSTSQRVMPFPFNSIHDAVTPSLLNPSAYVYNYFNHSIQITIRHGRSRRQV